MKEYNRAILVTPAGVLIAAVLCVWKWLPIKAVLAL